MSVNETVNNTTESHDVLEQLKPVVVLLLLEQSSNGYVFRKLWATSSSCFTHKSNSVPKNGTFGIVEINQCDTAILVIIDTEWSEG